MPCQYMSSHIITCHRMSSHRPEEVQHISRGAEQLLGAVRGHLAKAGQEKRKKSRRQQALLNPIANVNTRTRFHAANTVPSSTKTAQSKGADTGRQTNELCCAHRHNQPSEYKASRLALDIPPTPIRTPPHRSFRFAGVAWRSRDGRACLLLECRHEAQDTNSHELCGCGPGSG